MTQALLSVGIDVSKATLDVCLRLGKRERLRRFANTRDGFTELVEWLHKQAGSENAVHICLEATGTYHDALAQFLYQQGIRVSVLSSAILPAFRKSEGFRTKTDRQDARLLALLCQQKKPAGWKPMPEEQEHLQMLLERVEDLELQKQQEKNRLENSRLSVFVVAQIQEHVDLLEQWRKQTLEEIASWVESHKDLQKALKLLLTLKGVGELTAYRLLGLLGADGSRFESAPQVVAFVGLDVVEKESGTSVRGGRHISKKGSSQVRKWLALPAQVAKRWDPDMRQWAEELAARGKCFKQIRVACMRKLLHLAYGILKHEQEYDRSLAWPGHQPVQKEARAAA